MKKNPKARGGWRLAQTGKIEMENIAPILSVGVDRTYFAERKTILAFDEGALANVCILKQSELEQFASIPLQVVQGIVALPANVIQVRIWDVNNDAVLIAAQNRLIAEQVSYLEKLGKFKLDTMAQAPTSAATPVILQDANKPKYTPLTEAAVDVKPESSVTADWTNICKSTHVGSGAAAGTIVVPNPVVLGGVQP